jgi:hypothetical protein
MRRSFLIYCLSIFCLVLDIGAQPAPSADLWQPSEPGFRAVGITSIHSTFWVCGVGEGIASSSDGQSWQIKHHQETGGALLLGIEFASDTFGYAYGTGGKLLTTEDGGTTWSSHLLGNDTILLASFVDPNHGIFRTSESLFYVNGNNSPQPISQPSEVLKRFKFTPSLVALTSEKMGVLLSEGPFSEAGFLTTTNGGKTWVFYDPPSTNIKSFLRVNGAYWTTGSEVAGKDKPGGGYSVPMAMKSDDGFIWSHSSNEIKACHWESCGLCTTRGCLASGTLLTDFFNPTSTYFSIPKGNLTAKWAVISNHICSIHDGLSCATLGNPLDVQAAPTTPTPAEQSVPPLNTKVPTGSLLRCLICSLEPVYVDEKAQGRFTVHISLLIRSDGTVDTATIQNAPSDSVQHKIQDQVTEWLFEPPMRDGKPIRVSNQSDLVINVVRSK